MDEATFYHMQGQLQWQQAKGHLWAMLETYVRRPIEYGEMRMLVEQFIKDVEEQR